MHGKRSFFIPLRIGETLAKEPFQCIREAGASVGSDCELILDES